MIVEFRLEESEGRLVNKLTNVDASRFGCASTSTESCAAGARQRSRDRRFCPSGRGKSGDHRFRRGLASGRDDLDIRAHHPAFWDALADGGEVFRIEEWLLGEVNGDLPEWRDGALVYRVEVPD